MDAATDARDDPLSKYQARIEAAVEGWLRPYLVRISATEIGGVAGKEFNDPVWGTIPLDASEVVVLDSPLLQRLRRIRQLGVAQYVYPGANHTRLEHSIGVAHQVRRLTNSLDSHNAEPGFGRIPPDWEEILRMAALCHDVGHGLMSHVVENALRTSEDCEDLVLAFQRHLKKDTESQLSEIAAYFMIRSPAFAELITRARDIGKKTPIARMNELMADCIVGISSDDRLPLIHEVISGPFDCDKLDYMTRDAMMCGVPVVTDVTRLIQKVRAVELTTANLPHEIAAAVTDVGGTHTIVAMARSGASTLHEVSLGRSLMHDKIYRHHKVRATEVMVASVVAQIGPLLDEYSPMIPLAIYDDEFISLRKQQLDDLASEQPDATSEQAREVAADIAGRVRNRDLFVRAFAFSQKMPFDAYKDDPKQRADIERLIRDADVGDSRAELTNLIVTRLTTIIDALGKTDLLADFPDFDPFPYIWIDPPVVKKTSVTDTDQSRAYLVNEDRKLVAMGTVSAETRGWADAYINTRDVGYVFCPREIAPYVQIATEIVLRVDRQIRIPREMHSYAKVEPSAVDKIRASLLDAGFYAGLPRDLRPLPEFLTRADTTRRIREAVDQFAGYMGPNPGRDPNKVQSASVTNSRIRDWLSQFDDPELALVLIENMMLIDRKMVAEAINAFFATEASSSFDGAAFVPVGQAKDGSSVVTYFSGDVAGNHNGVVMSLSDAVASGRPLIFVDDFIGRGSSIVSIFQSLMGAESTEGLEEVRPAPLATDIQDALRSRPIAIVVAAGFAEGVGHVREELTKLGLSSVTHALHDGANLPKVTTALASTETTRAENFVAALESVGLQLLLGEARADDRKLGYGNEGLLVVSAFNTPTMTTTAIWRDAERTDFSWRSLFPRRSKK